jgi:hypothetical protein
VCNTRKGRVDSHDTMKILRDLQTQNKEIHPSSLKPSLKRGSFHVRINIFLDTSKNFPWLQQPFFCGSL